MTAPAHKKVLHHLHARRLHRHYKRQMHKLHVQRLGWHKQWRHWRYKNTSLVALSLIVFFLLTTTDWVKQAIAALGETSYVGAFVAGIFFVSVFTVAPASVVLFNIADKLHPIETAILAGIGGVFGDYALFRFFKHGVFDELKPLFLRVTTHKLAKLFYTPYFGFLLPIIGMIFIASPGPDEVGIGLLGLSKIKPWQFLLVTFLLNTVGILLVIVLARANF